MLVLMPAVLLASFSMSAATCRGCAAAEGISGQTVCRSDRTITVDGVTVGGALDRDHLRRPPAHLACCRVIGGGDVVLMDRQSEKALDFHHRRPGRSTLDRLGALTTPQSSFQRRAAPEPFRLWLSSLAVEPPAARRLAMHRRWRSPSGQRRAVTAGRRRPG